MKGGISRLSDRECAAFVKRSQRGGDGPRKLSDGGGLYLTLTPKGTPVWRIKYRLGTAEDGNRREGLYAVGVYPEITLAAARAELEFVRDEVKAGRNPVKARLINRAEETVANDTTFRAMANKWYAAKVAEWKPVHAKQVRQLLDRDALPFIGALPMDKVTPLNITRLIERVIARGAKSQAPKLRSPLERIFDYSIAQGVNLPMNPVSPSIEVMPRRTKGKPKPFIRTFEGLGELLRATETANLSSSVRMALKLLAFTGCGSRPGNVTSAEWKEFDLDSDNPTWSIPRAKMKAEAYTHDHEIALGPTILHALREWRNATGGTGYLFPSPHGNGKPITLESLEKFYREQVAEPLRGKHHPHGWRKSLSTLANEDGRHKVVAIDLHLDHVNPKTVQRTYDTAKQLKGRRKLMYWWDSQLIAAQYGTVPLTRKRPKVRIA